MVYDSKDQESIVTPFLAEITKARNAGALRPLEGTLLAPTSEAEKKAINEAFDALIMTLITMVPELYVLKNPAFREEREWRLISHLLRNTMRVPTATPEYVDFFAKPDRIVPFQRIPLLKKGAPPIVRVVLGPRNITPEDVVRAALSKHGFTDVEVAKSCSSYR